MNKFLIIADAPNHIEDVRTELLEFKGYKRIFLDGIANQLSNELAADDLVIGDFDTITQETITRLSQRGVALQELSNQDTTDLDKAIEYARGQNASEIVIINALGGRFDHSCYNYRILRKYAHLGIDISLSNFFERITYIENARIQINGPIGCRIGIISAPMALITSSGLLYDMHNYSIALGEAESTSNSLQSTCADLTVHGSAFISFEKSAALWK